MGVKRNFVYNSFLTISSYLIGLITFPYISRVLGASNIGIISFVDNTINYFVLFSTLGIGTIGAREIARYQNDKKRLDSVFSSLVTLCLIFTTVVLIIYFVVIQYVPNLNVHKELFYVGSAKLIFSVFLIEWFYRGIEKFKYITIRNISIKILYAFSIFAFVRNKDDYVIYFILTTSVVTINAFINNFYARKFVKFSFEYIKIKPYFKQSFYLGSYSILTSMYTTFNVIYLGWATDTTQVGYYWVALTIYGIILGIFSSFTSVMMPRMSSLLSEGETESFNRMIKKSFNALFTICYPLIICSVILAPQIVGLISGDGYQGAVIPMQIIMPLLIVVGIAQVVAVQVLMPMRMDRIILLASSIGAGIGLLFNLLLVRAYGCIGTAIVLLLSETAVTAFYLYVVYKNKIVSFPWKPFISNLIYSVPYIMICYSAVLAFDRKIYILLNAALVSTLYFFVFNIYIIKNKDLLKILQSVKQQISLDSIKRRCNQE